MNQRNVKHWILITKNTFIIFFIRMKSITINIEKKLEFLNQTYLRIVTQSISFFISQSFIICRPSINPTILPTLTSLSYLEWHLVPISIISIWAFQFPLVYSPALLLPPDSSFSGKGLKLRPETDAISQQDCRGGRNKHGLKCRGVGEKYNRR